MRRVFLFLIIFFFGCAAIEKQTKPAASKAEKIYRSNCSLCHRLYAPDLYGYQKLEKYVKKYGQGLTFGERQELLKYFKETSKEQK